MNAFELLEIAIEKVDAHEDKWDWQNERYTEEYVHKLGRTVAAARQALETRRKEVLSGAFSMRGFPADMAGRNDPLYAEAVRFVRGEGRVSISSTQRKFKIGYNRAAQIVEAMEDAGICTEASHDGRRELL